MNSTDGFLQFYGVNDQFVAEMQVNLPDDDYHTYSFVNSEKMQQMKRISLETPYGRFTPTEREVLTLAQLKKIVLEYYEHLTYDRHNTKKPKESVCSRKTHFHLSPKKLHLDFRSEHFSKFIANF